MRPLFLMMVAVAAVPTHRKLFGQLKNAFTASKFHIILKGTCISTSKN